MIMLQTTDQMMNLPAVQASCCRLYQNQYTKTNKQPRFPLTFLPKVRPGESASTMNPVNAFPADTPGSGFVRASTKYQLAFPPFVIHIFCPLRIYSFPFFTAFVLIAATSDPAPGSVTQYACNIKQIIYFQCLNKK